MIRIKVIKKNNVFDEITFRGHADYDDLGKDIVCAAVSATILNSINAMILIDKDSININQKDNNIDLKVINNNEIINKLIINMLSSLESIKKQYPKNIEIIEEEI